jgi:hypothetical protein
MPRWRGGSGAGAGADLVTLIVLELSGLVQWWGGDEDGAGGWSWMLLSIVCVTDMLRKRFKSCFAIEKYILVK